MTNNTYESFKVNITTTIKKQHQYGQSTNYGNIQGNIGGNELQNIKGYVSITKSIILIENVPHALILFRFVESE